VIQAREGNGDEEIMQEAGVRVSSLKPDSESSILVRQCRKTAHREFEPWVTVTPTEMPILTNRKSKDAHHRTNRLLAAAPKPATWLRGKTNRRRKP
jgi:hypothetical protein